MNSPKNLLGEGNKVEPITEEINFKELFNLIKRNKKIISFLTFASIIIGGINAFTTKKVWEGEFQIVLENENKENTSKALAQALGGNNLTTISLPRSSSNNFQTEIGILQSPSVLMDIFKYVKKEKSKTKDPINNLRFNQWKKNSIKIKLQSGSAILDLKYRDSNKDIIIPVLRKISEKYQKYSGKKRNRNIELGLAYFEKQIAIFEKKSLESFKKAEQFAIDQDLTIVDSNKSSLKNFEDNINIEVKRVQAANQIRLIDDQLSKISNIDENSNSILYYIYLITLEGKTNKNPILERYKINKTDLIDAKTIYKENDKYMQNLKREEILLLKELRSDLINNLEAQRQEALSIMSSAKRADGVLIKYKQLLNESTRDAEGLESLKRLYNATKLDKAKIQDPWELITKPTLSPDPVAPVKKRIVFISAIFGIIIGSIFALLKEKSSGLIFNFKEFEISSSYKFLGDFDSLDSANTRENFVIFLENIKSKNINEICFLIVGNFDQEILLNLESLLKDSYKKEMFLITKDYLSTKKFKHSILIFSSGITTYYDFRNINEKIKIGNNYPMGYIVFNK